MYIYKINIIYKKGYANISLDDALKNPGKWGIDEIFELDGGSKMKKKYNTEVFGKIYM